MITFTGKVKNNLKGSGALLRFLYLLLTLSLVTGCQEDLVDAPVDRLTIRVELDESTQSFEVHLVIPSSGIHELWLRDMSRRSDACPGVEYTVARHENANLSSEKINDLLLTRLTPSRLGSIEISYSVSPVSSLEGISPAILSECSAILASSDNIFADGLALFLAMRPFDENGQPFRFGETEIVLGESLRGRSSVFSTGTELGEGRWLVERFDDARFALLGVGSWVEASIHSSDPARVAIYHLGDERATISTTTEGFAAAVLEAGLRNLSEAFEAGGQVSGYKAYVLESNTTAAQFGSYAGEARENAQIALFDASITPQRLSLLLLHEAAHTWVPGRLGQYDPASTPIWIGEGLAEYLAWNEFVGHGVSPSSAIIARLNAALQNRSVDRTPEILDYDHGVLAAFLVHVYSDGGLDGDGIARFVRTLMLSADEVLTEDRFWSAVESNELRAEIAAGSTLEQLLPCRIAISGTEFTLAEGLWPTFDTGWSLSEQEPGLISDVRVDGPAALAGLAPGNTLIRHVSGGYGDIHHPIEVLVERDGITGVLSVMPRGDTSSEPHFQYVQDVQAVASWAQVSPSTSCLSTSEMLQ